MQCFPRARICPRLSYTETMVYEHNISLHHNQTILVSTVFFFFFLKELRKSRRKYLHIFSTVSERRLEVPYDVYSGLVITSPLSNTDPILIYSSLASPFLSKIINENVRSVRQIEEKKNNNNNSSLNVDLVEQASVNFNNKNITSI